jgi:hypothetical protein
VLDWNSPDLIDRLYALKNIPTLSARLSEMRKAYALFHSMPGYAQALQSILAKGATQRQATPPQTTTP